MIRPASFNGVYALKPTWGVVSREGAKMLSAYCDTVGWYGRCVADLALVAEAFRLRDLAAQEPVSVRGLRVAMCRTPYWEQGGAGGAEGARDGCRAVGESRRARAGARAGSRSSAA